MDTRLFFIFIFCISLFSCGNDPQSNTTSVSKTAAAKTKSATPKFGLTFEDRTVAADSSFCLPMTAEGFVDILSMQFSVNWDPAVLTYQSVQHAKLPNVGVNNFGTHITDKGQLTFLWFDMNLQPQTIANGNPVFELCFTATGAPGTSSKVKISSIPTAKEVTNKNKEFLNLSHSGNVITVE